MKVLHLIDSLNVGGAQALLVTYAQQAMMHDQKANIICLRNRSVNPVTTGLEATNAEVTYLPELPLWNIYNIIRLIKIIKKKNADVLHTHLTNSNILGIICALWLHKPVVVSMHSVITGRPIKYLREKIELHILRYATKIIAVGEAVSNDYSRLFPQKVTTLTNSVNDIPTLPETKRTEIRISLGINTDGPLLIAIGRLTELKGFDDLLSAFQKVQKKHPLAHLIIAGDGHLKDSLKKETEKNGLQNSVHWLGMRSDIPLLLASSDLYVSAAHWEGLSIALLEALSAGLPAVVTKVGDAPKVLEAGLGYLVPPKSPEQLAHAIEKMLENPQNMKKMGQIAKEEILSKYGSTAWFMKLSNIYSEVITTFANRQGKHQ